MRQQAAVAERLQVELGAALPGECCDDPFTRLVYTVGDLDKRA
ncbi:hypothetical protein [Micromonospora sp. WMMD1155]|nr:hypothetical protein [Micromonospora sp. WMMD1155]WFE54888.1 hypothetical protein O7617_33010 [Micromonospora sp. WMMD1155]